MVEIPYLRILLNSGSVAGIADTEGSPLCRRETPSWFAVVNCSLHCSLVLGIHAKVRFDLSGFAVAQNGSVA